MKYKAKKIIYILQIIIFNISFFFCKFFLKNKKKQGWVIGVDEIGLNVYNLGLVLPNATTVCFSELPLFNLKYNYRLPNILFFKNYYRMLYGPVLLGYLANQNSHFWYNWHTGFLINREYEFRFLKSISKKIVCVFAGDDIRSIYLSQVFSRNNNIDANVNYYERQFYTNKYDDEKRYIAKIADMYSDVVFNLYLDQMSYLKSRQFAPAYIYDKNNFYRNDLKFKNLDTIKILHAPSNIFLKGTPLVRAAIKKLELEGYKFEYTELINMPNEVVINHLKAAHIVLNQFYLYDIGFGIFGIEAMAHHTALLTSYDSNKVFLYDHLVLDGFSQCMLDTKYWQVYDNLKFLLDNPEKIKYYADRGYEFAYKHYTPEAASRYINNILKQNGVI